MIFNFIEEEYNFKDIIEKAIFDEVGSNISKNNFSLDKIHDYFSNSEVPNLLNKLYTIFRHKEFQDEYDKLCKFIKEKFHHSETKYQSIPSVRINIPGTKSVDFHNDMFYGHGENVFNYWLPITNVSNTNSMMIIDERKSIDLLDNVKKSRISILEFNNLCKEVCRPLNMNYGEVFKFNSKLIHGTLFNKTNKTRVSIDFRMLNKGENTGLKDLSFFIEKRTNSEKVVKPKNLRAYLYFSREGKEEILPSQKYQQLNSLEFCREKNITPIRLETELSGFDYYPTLFHLLECCKSEKFKDIVIYSKHNLPSDESLREKFRKKCNEYNITIHFVLEDISERY